MDFRAILGCSACGICAVNKKLKLLSIYIYDKISQVYARFAIKCRPIKIFNHINCEHVAVIFKSFSLPMIRFISYRDIVIPVI